jgi:hypothetical protein
VPQASGRLKGSPLVKSMYGRPVNAEFLSLVGALEM